MQRTCLKCETIFEAAYEARFCSHSCAARHSNVARTKPPVQKTCPVCAQQFTVPFKKRSRETCGRSCAWQLSRSRIDVAAVAAKISATKLEGFRSGRLVHHGAPHSEETKRRMSELASDGRRKGPRNAMHGRRHSDASREMMSATRTARIVAGVYDPTRWAKRGELFAAKAERLIPYRSLFERRAIEQLEADPAVESFQFEPIRIPYVYGHRDDGLLQRRNYIPDFLIRYRDGRTVLVEVKPTAFIGAAINVAKFAAAREHCDSQGWSFEVWTQERLA